MNGGTISGNEVTGDGGGVSVQSNGSFTMNGGTISNNKAKLTANTASGNGGGVYVQSNGAFTMNGGTISDNTTERWGGGICGNPGASSMITINGGTISGNSSTYDTTGSTSAVNGGGGGIYLGCGTLSITGGIITENSAVSNGGVERYAERRCGRAREAGQRHPVRNGSQCGWERAPGKRREWDVAALHYEEQQRHRRHRG